MRKLILYSAQSLDGFIARTDGRVDWLFTDQDYGYYTFYESIDTTLMGRHTYEQILTFGDFPYPDKQNFVFSQKEELQLLPAVTQIREPIAGFVQSLKKKPGKDIWLVGGGKLNAGLLQAGLIDQLELAVHPILLGQGIPLIDGKLDPQQWKFESVKSFSTGMLILRYCKR